MTNLLEKSLLIGFGILILTIFSSLITPLLGEIVEFNRNEKRELENYMNFINEIDQSIIFAIQNPNESYLKKIKYPNGINISFYDHFAEYAFFFDEKVYNKILVYNETFSKSNFHNIPSKIYTLNISYNSFFIIIKLINSVIV